MSTNEPLDDTQQRDLRNRKIIGESEVAIKIGDLFIAENVLTGERRTITIVEPVTETKQILRG